MVKKAGRNVQNCIKELFRHGNHDLPAPILEYLNDALDYPSSTGSSRIVSAPQIQPLNDFTTQADLQAARRNSAVRRRGKVFLPITAPDHVPLPHLLLRSALFCAATIARSETEREASVLKQVEIATHKDQLIEQSGLMLNRYDLRVYATCVSLYRDRALTTDADSSIEISYGMLGAMIGGRSASALIALRESLWRLSRTSIATHISPVDEYGAPPAKHKLKLSPLLQVDFPEGYAGCSPIGEDGKSLSPSGGSLLRIGISARTGYLYGENAWSAVPQEALMMTGLRGWLATYYATHSTSFALPLPFLYRLTGLASKTGDFTRQLTTALTTLKEKTVPERIRVLSYVLTKDDVPQPKGSKICFKNTRVAVEKAPTSRKKKATRW